MLKMNNQFNCSLENNCQDKSVPASLLELVAVVLKRPNIKAQSDSATYQPVLTISQLLMFNSSVRRRKELISIPYHCKERETPLPVYLGVMTQTKIRKRQLVDNLYELGLRISYDCIVEISTEVGNKICHYYMMEKAICPPKLKHGLFTTGAVDNIDHNPSYTTAHYSLYGTGISLFQHPDENFYGVMQDVDRDYTTFEVTVAHLPEAYTNIAPIANIRHVPPISKHSGPNKATCQLIPKAVEKKYV